MIIDHEKKFLFVCVPKTASTSFRTLFGASLTCLPHIYHKNITEVLAENPDLISYTKAAFTRNPYSRIMSAYQNLVSDAGHHELHSEILSFKNFDDFILNFEQTDCANFRHLKTQTSYTYKDGELMMDFLGKFESLNEDFFKLKNILGIKNLSLPHTRVTNYFSPTNNIKPKSRDKICEIYEEDFLNFNYEF
jgi:hypothetical protein